MSGLVQPNSSMGRAYGKEGWLIISVGVLYFNLSEPFHILPRIFGPGFAFRAKSNQPKSSTQIRHGLTHSRLFSCLLASSPSLFPIGVLIDGQCHPCSTAWILITGWRL